MFAELFTPEQLTILGQIIFIDLVLAGDNAIIIGMVASKFPVEQRKKVIFWGIGGAVVLRIILTMLTAYLPVFDKIKKELNVPILTDIHNAEQCEVVSKHVDVLQIPAFLCRQTDLLIAAAKTNKIINVKKGQFLAPWDMVNVTKKISDSGNDKILVTERGASFGYNTLVSDMRSLPIMAKNGYPVIFDATHSVQQPGGQGEKSGGQREFVEYLARAAVAVGVAGVFIETHQDPDNAPSDGPNMVPIDKLDMLKQQSNGYLLASIIFALGIIK